MTIDIVKLKQAIKANMSYSELCNRSGITYQTLFNIFQGNDPRLSNVVKIIKVLKEYDEDIEKVFLN